MGVCLLSLFRRCFPRLLLVLNPSSKLTGMLITTQPAPIRQQMCLSCQSSPRPQAIPHLSWVGAGRGGCLQGERVGHPAGLQVPALNLCRFLLTPTPPLPAGKHTQVPWLPVWFVVPPLSTGLVFVVQSLSCVRLFVTPWTAAHQASLSFTISELAQTYIH